MTRQPPDSTLPDTLFPDTTLFRSAGEQCAVQRPQRARHPEAARSAPRCGALASVCGTDGGDRRGAAKAQFPVHRQEHAPILSRCADSCNAADGRRSEEHTSELQSLMRISYAVFCLKKQNKIR